MLLQIPLKIIQTTLNYLLRLDPENFEKLCQLPQQTLAITVLGIPGFRFYCAITNDGVELDDSYLGKAIATLSGGPVSLLRLLMSSSADSAAAIKQSGVELEGDTLWVTDLHHVLSAFAIDWEELLSKATGDHVAHEMGNIARNVRHYGQRSKASLQQTLLEYLQEEIKLLPPREEFEDFSNDIDALRANVDRLVARVQQL